MTHYIEAEKLIAEIERFRATEYDGNTFGDDVANGALDYVLEEIIPSLQQDEKAVELEMCSQAYWEERGWMMIPPDVTLKGIESLLEQVRKKLQQEQPEGLHFTPLNRLIQKIPSGNWNDTVNNYAKKLRDCLIKEGYRKDAEVLQGYISYMNGNNVPMATMDGQEQPQVADASKMEEVEKETNEYWDYVFSAIGWDENSLMPINHKEFLAFARHFYELGKNARK